MNRLETNPANLQDGMVLGMMDAAQIRPPARYGDRGGTRSHSSGQLDLEQRLAMDISFLQTTNEGISLCNDHTLPVLKAITGQDLGVEPEKWKSWWTDQLGYCLPIGNA